MDDVNSDERRRTAETSVFESPRKRPERRLRDGDWVLFAPGLLLVGYGLLLLAVSAASVSVPSRVQSLGVAVATLVLVLACLEAGWRIVEAANRERDAFEGWSPTPEQLLSVGWVVVSAALLALLRAFPHTVHLPPEQAQLIVAVLVASILLSSIVSGPLLAVVRYVHRSS